MRGFQIGGLVVAVVLAAAPAHADAFLKAIADMPLMPGLTEKPDAVVFESDRGRIVKASAHGAAAHSKPTTDFYLASLPALGWVRDGAGDSGVLAFRRGTEELKLTIIEVTGDGPPGTTVDFELVVKLASSKLPE